MFVGLDKIVLKIYGRDCVKNEVWWTKLIFYINRYVHIDTQSQWRSIQLGTDKPTENSWKTSDFDVLKKKTRFVRRKKTWQWSQVESILKIKVHALF